MRGHGKSRNSISKILYEPCLSYVIFLTPSMYCVLLLCVRGLLLLSSITIRPEFELFLQCAYPWVCCPWVWFARRNTPWPIHSVPSITVIHQSMPVSSPCLSLMSVTCFGVWSRACLWPHTHTHTEIDIESVTRLGVWSQVLLASTSTRPRSLLIHCLAGFRASACPSWP